MSDSEAEPLVFDYLNWRGEAATRHALPMRTFYAATEHHPQPQWLLEAYDVDRGAVRQFAMKDMRPVGQHLRDVAQKAADSANREAHARDRAQIERLAGLVQRLLEVIPDWDKDDETLAAVQDARLFLDFGDVPVSERGTT